MPAAGATQVHCACTQRWLQGKGNINKINTNFCEWNFWIDTIILSCIILISLLYLSFRHFNDFNNKKKTSSSQKT